MNVKNFCPYCGKENPKDKRGRSTVFCSSEHRKLYTKKKIQENIHYCNVCGKIADFDDKYLRWKKTCGSKECLKKAASNAQKIGVKNRKNISIKREDIVELYINQNMSRADIAKHYNCSEAYIKKYLRLNKIYKGIANRDIHTKHTKQILHGNPKYVNIKKQKETCLKKYGAPSNLCLYNGVKPKNSSKKEIDWIKSLNNPMIIPHHVIKIEKYKWVIVDGYDPITNTILEFLGDYFHGNPEIFNPNKINKTLHKRMKTLYRETFKRFDMLKSLGYDILYIWEKDYKDKKEPIKY